MSYNFKNAPLDIFSTVDELTAIFDTLAAEVDLKTDLVSTRVLANSDNTIKLAIPGVSKENVSVELDGSLVTVTADPKVENPRHPLEKPFSYKFRLREKSSKVSAKVLDGVLILTVTPDETAKKKIEIQ